MAQVYNQNFDALSDGALAGQDSYTAIDGGGSGTVQTSGAYSGKGVKFYGAYGFDRALGSSLGTATYILRIYRTNTTNAFDIYLYQVSLGAYCLVEFDSTGKILIFQNPSWQDTGLSYTSNTWYKVTIEFDNPNKRYRVKLDSGSFSSWYTFPAAQTNFSQLRFYNPNTSVDTYMDDIYIDDALGADYPSTGGPVRKIRGMGITR